MVTSVPSKKTAGTLVPPLLICNGGEHLVSHIMTHWDKRKLNSSNFSALWLHRWLLRIWSCTTFLSALHFSFFIATHLNNGIKIAERKNEVICFHQSWLEHFLMISWLVLEVSTCAKNPSWFPSWSKRCFVQTIDFGEGFLNSCWNVWSVWKSKKQTQISDYLNTISFHEIILNILLLHLP